MMTRKTALLVVDVQKDFCPGGALPAAGGNDILPAVNRYVEQARERGIPIYASRDWHPAETTHFKVYGGEWPPHCVQGTDGAHFHPELKLPADAVVISKGDAPNRPGYSAFEGRTPEGKSLLDDLRDRQIGGVYVAGLTMEDRVKQTVLDALQAGLDVAVLSDAVAGIDAKPGDADRALADMLQAGARAASRVELAVQNMPS